MTHLLDLKSGFGAEQTITNERHFLQRRRLLQQFAALSLLPGELFANQSSNLKNLTNEITETDFKLVSSYNNYIEFSENKEMVRHLARDLDIQNWQLSINGLVAKPTVLNLADILGLQTETRVYRLRCVEGWSAVIPWQGFTLASLLEQVGILPSAKYVKFTGLLDPKIMIGQRRNNLKWPYQEGLRLDEALHPLTFIATGMYGKSLSKQNGAPLRLVVPWKYGYKSIKAITEIQLSDTQPDTSWQLSSPNEYGFYANVNPKVAHPRWSQRREVRLGELKKRRTDMFNGYAPYLEGLYSADDVDTLF